MSSNLYNLSYTIKKLSLLTKAGELDITRIFDAINIHDSIFSPCITGSIIISDSLGLTRETHYDGTESLDIEIEKRDCKAKIKRRFRVYGAPKHRVCTGDLIETYTLHFTSAEWIISKEKKIRKTFESTYSDIVSTLLVSDEGLGLNEDFISIEPTEGIRKIILSGKNPIDCILDCTKKAVNSELSPTYMFFENVKGYNFFSLHTLAKNTEIASINFDPKAFYGAEDTSLFGARKMEVIAQNNLLQNIEAGLHGGTNISFSPLERTIISTPVSLNDFPGIGFTAGRTGETGRGFTVRHNPNASRSFNSLTTVGVTSGGFRHSKYLTENDPESLNSEDDTRKYIIQRRALLKSYTNTRIRLEMPGNFDLSSGYMINFSKSIAGGTTVSNEEDTSLSGKYMIIASRNIIRYDSHITILEIATNTFKGKLYQPVIWDEGGDDEDYYGRINERDDGDE